MNILYCGDKFITDGLIISILSLIKHEKTEFHIYIFSMDYLDKESVSQKDIEYLEKIIRKENKKSFIRLIDVSSYFKDYLPTKNMDTMFTPYCMLRLYADLVPNMPSKILYLDNDVVAYNSFKEFYDIDNSKYELVGVRDFYGQYFYSKNKIKKDYLNSGVLLLNLDLIKKSKSFEKARIVCKNRKMLLPDQAALNKYCRPKLILKRKYNEQHTLKSDTVFRHFTTTFKFFPYFRTQKVKPWNVDRLHEILKCHEFDDIIEEYQKIKEEMKCLKK